LNPFGGPEFWTGLDRRAEPTPGYSEPLVSIVFSTSLSPPNGHPRTHFPPYNIERLSEDRYQISLAVAGFSPDEINRHR